MRLNSSASHKEKCFISNVCMLLADCARVLSDHPPRACGKNLSTLLLLSQGFGSPRACGENIRAGNRQTLRYGSPPHMRGKLHSEIYRTGAFRITPAHAGKTFSQVRIADCQSDHPRTCGENQNTRAATIRANGSPPHMRGKQIAFKYSRCEKRITPAHAGKTQKHDAARAGTSDHPRTCGENYDIFHV